MGTNYYIKANVPCVTCAHPDEDGRLHIGKHSYGWAFIFEPEPYITFKQWKAFLEQSPEKIFNEYGDQCSLEIFLAMVESEKGKLWELTAPRRYPGYCTERRHEYQDHEGYRFSIRPRFS